MRWNILVVLTVFFIILIVAPFSRAADVNVSAEDKASACLNASVMEMNDLLHNGMAITRLNDSYAEASNLYSAQVVLKEQQKPYDFSLVLPYCDQIKSAHDLALDVQDQFVALQIFYNTSIVSGMNTNSIDSKIEEIKTEISNERYEKVKPLIDAAYEEINNAKSSNTALSLFYNTTTGGISYFFKKNWKILTTVALILIVILVAYRIKIMKWMVQKKIKKLELRKQTIKELIMRTQKDYFEKGMLSEGTYSIRTKKFAELMRDIERQVPLLQEELARLERRR